MKQSQEYSVAPGRASAQGDAPRPVEPDFRAAQPARLVLDFKEDGERVHEADEGWARIDGPWVHWFSEQQGYWQTWPRTAVLCIEWSLA